MAEVILKGIKKVYSNREMKKKLNNSGVMAVEDFSLTIADKEFIVLVGPSGCGKSTTLRMIAGLEEISEGELYINGRLVNDVPSKDRDIAMVFQNYALYPHMTVYENMAFSLKARRVDKKTIDRKVKETAEILDIISYLDRKPKELSGGQRQRVAIGRAIVRDPQVFLMDEPLSNLDAKLRGQMRAEIAKLRQSVNTTFVYVTHDQTEAMTLGDRVVIMNDGVIQQVGTPQEVFDYPANLFVAGFIGMPGMNLFDGELTKNAAGEYAVKLGPVSVALSADKQARLAGQGVGPRPVTIGVRPERIKLDRQKERALKGTVVAREMMGSTVHLHLQTDGGQTVILARSMEEECGDNEPARVGSAVSFSFDGDAAHLFSKTEGRNLAL